MSPQAAAVPSQSHRVSLVESDNSFIASLIEAADEAYQKTSDEFTTTSAAAAAQVHAGPGRLATAAATATGRPRFNLRKRKAVPMSVNTGTSCAGSLSAVNSAFLSGLFADLQQTSNTTSTTNANHHDDGEEHYVTDGESCPGTPVPSPKKRARLGRSLSRCTKSYASLSVLASCSEATYNSTDSYVEREKSRISEISDQTTTSMTGAADADATDNNHEPTAAAPTVSAATSTTSTASTVASDVLADSLSAAAALADAIFPHLPATVSESPLRKSPSKMSASSSNSNNSADLTAQPASSTEVSTSTDAGATSTNLHVEPEKELTLEEVFATSEGEGPASAAVTPTDEDPDEVVTKEGEDSYGWFLALDHDVDAPEEHITDAYATAAASAAGAAGNETTSSMTAALAFQAPVSATAGCAAHDAEVEWAKAADTVDDVLGDLPF